MECILVFIWISLVLRGLVRWLVRFMWFLFRIRIFRLVRMDVAVMVIFLLKNV